MTNNQIASQASSGGKARAAKLTREQRTEIAQKAVNSRWDKVNIIPRATHMGKLIIADKEISCAVLETGKRVITQQALFTAIGRTGRPQNKVDSETCSSMPVFLAADNLKPFISEELKNALTPVAFKTPKTKVAYGYDAAILPMICEVYLQARDESLRREINKESKVLQPNQEHIVKACDLLMRGFARVGIIALVDEATGYQEQRARDELHKILAAYISAELLPWVKRFPDEFFKQIFKIYKWEYKPGLTATPRYVGKFIKQYVYDQLPPGVLQELERLNPRNEHWQRKHRHHQYLTPNTGNEHLDRQIVAIITIMKISDDKEDFERNFAKWHNKEYQERLPLTVTVEPAT